MDISAQASSLTDELFGSLRCHKLHRRALNGLGDRLGITEVVLLSL
jgi:hypothetical protein